MDTTDIILNSLKGAASVLISRFKDVEASSESSELISSGNYKLPLSCCRLYYSQ